MLFLLHFLRHLLSQYVSDDVDGLLLLLNTVGGDIEAGLAIAELVAGMTLPTVTLAHFYVEIVDRVPLPRCGEGGRGKGQMLPQATFGAHLCAVRICFSRLLREKQHS